MTEQAQGTPATGASQEGAQQPAESQTPTQGGEGTQQAAQLPDGALWQQDADKLIGGRVKEDRDRRASEAGFESWDSMIEAAGAHNEQLEAQKTEAQKLTETRDTLQAENEQLYAQLAEREMTSSLRDALTEAGVNPQRIQAAMRLADLEALDIGDDGKVTGAAEQIQAIQEAAPEFFGQTSQRRAPDLAAANHSPSDPESAKASFLANALLQGNQT